ncbi:DUF4157 domain-containing protein [Mycobacterium sp. OTB74]|uniref:eCIS core domain-containing protein n=1 Tax=Mycobacterium sp. OTB74 TaxID=1853452 RepID=UPI0024757656|nr:DUF4157 domain-containing protein [Mycobacterium sp. OTB74]
MVNDSLRTEGQPLDAGSREFMEARFGHNFSHVRVHTGAQANASAGALRACAYTSGSHVVFGANQYEPHTSAGRRLLAHELAHVVQQDLSPHRVAIPVQRKPAKPADSGPAAQHIDDVYGAGTFLSAERWRFLLNAAQNAFNRADLEAATLYYSILCTDLATLAQADLVTSSHEVHYVDCDRDKHCTGTRKGVNFTWATWGSAQATTGFVDDATGEFPAGPWRPGAHQSLAIVLSRSAFVPDKTVSLGILRHEMSHAGDDAANAAKMVRAGSATPGGLINNAGLEVRGYAEGFMTMFKLTSPAPTDFTVPAFIELLGVADFWHFAEEDIRKGTLRRLQRYFCDELDGPHRKSLEDFLRVESARTWPSEKTSPKDTRPGRPDFFHRLRDSIATCTTTVAPK